MSSRVAFSLTVPQLAALRALRQGAPAADVPGISAAVIAALASKGLLTPDVPHALTPAGIHAVGLAHFLAKASPNPARKDNRDPAPPPASSPPLAPCAESSV